MCNFTNKELNCAKNSSLEQQNLEILQNDITFVYTGFPNCKIKIIDLAYGY